MVNSAIKKKKYNRDGEKWPIRDKFRGESQLARLGAYGIKDGTLSDFWLKLLGGASWGDTHLGTIE